MLRALRIASVREIGPWRYHPASKFEDGAQIDMVIIRSDDVISLCEIKYTDAAYSIDKSYAQKLMQKREIFQKQFGTDKQLFWVLISSNGLKKTLYSEELIDGLVTLTDLFKVYGNS